MATLTITLPDNKEQDILKLLRDYKFISIRKHSKETEKIINDFKESLREMELIEKGEIEPITLEQFFDELKNVKSE